MSCSGRWSLLFHTTLSYRGTNLKRLLTLVIVLSSVTIAYNAHAIGATEYQVKAVYLYHFSRFIQWPESAWATPNVNFNVCVLGTDPFGESLSVLTQQTHEGRPIVLLYPSSAGEARVCQLLYIGLGDAAHTAAVLKALGDAPIMTVSSLPGFVEMGGGIGFVRQGKHVRFAINRGGCKHRGLLISAKLLEASIKIVDDVAKEKQP